MRKILLISKILFQDFILVNLIFTLIGAYTLAKYGAKSHGYLIIIKLLGYGFTIVYHFLLAGKTLYFYFNLGWSRIQISVSAILIDFGLMIVIFSMTKALE